MDIWMCKGIGLDNDMLFPLLDPLKLARYLRDQKDFNLEEDLREGSDFLKASANGQLNILKEYCDDFPDGLMDILAEADPKESLTGMNDHNGRSFLLCPPRYPWEQKKISFEGPEAVYQHICDVIMPFAFEDVKRELVYNLVQEFNEFAYG